MFSISYIRMYGTKFACSTKMNYIVDLDDRSSRNLKAHFASHFAGLFSDTAAEVDRQFEDNIIELKSQLGKESKRLMDSTITLTGRRQKRKGCLFLHFARMTNQKRPLGGEGLPDPRAGEVV